MQTSQMARTNGKFGILARAREFSLLPTDVLEDVVQTIRRNTFIGHKIETNSRSVDNVKICDRIAG